MFYNGSVFVGADINTTRVVAAFPQFPALSEPDCGNMENAEDKPFFEFSTSGVRPGTI